MTITILVTTAQRIVMTAPTLVTTILAFVKIFATILVSSLEIVMTMKALVMTIFVHQAYTLV